MSQSTEAGSIARETPPQVHSCKLFDRKTVYENPFETIISDIHQGPAIFYTDNVFPGPAPGWLVRRAEDLRTIYADNENFYKQGNTQFASMIGEDWDIIPTELDPPRHTLFRKALSPVYAPAKMNALDSRVREQARFFLNKFKAQGGCDFIEEFAIPFPVTIFLELLGLPLSEMEQFLIWERQLLHGNDKEARVTSVRAVRAYLLDAIKERHRRPTEDLISQALALEVDGRPITDDEVFGHCFNLYLGGLDTITANIGLHFYHLATHQQDQAALRAEPEKVVHAVEEFLRAYPAVTTMRLCKNPYTIGGQTFMPGEYVAMSTPLAGRDPDEYEAPNEVRLDRRPLHLTLGYGAHRCLGQHLARRELQIATQELLAELPTFGIKPGFVVPFYVGNIIHVEELPLVW